MKIDPTVYVKDQPRDVVYDTACCIAHKNGEIGQSDECDQTSPWED